MKIKWQDENGKRLISVVTTLHCRRAFFAGCLDSPTDDDSGGKNDPKTPRSTVPEDMVGHWNSGNVPSVGFYDASKGKFGDASGSGFFFNFTPDGYFECGGILQQSLYGCMDGKGSVQDKPGGIAGGICIVAKLSESI